MNNSALKQASFSNSREGNLTFFNESFFDPVKNRAETHKRSTYPISTQNLKSMKQNYVKQNETNSQFGTYSSTSSVKSRFKSLMLTLAIFVAGIGSVFGQCTHTIELTDTYGDGWNGGAVSVSVNGTVVLTNITLGAGFGPQNFNFTASAGQTIRVYTTIAGSWASERRIRVVNNTGVQVIALIGVATGTPTTGGRVGTAVCAAAPPPCASNNVNLSITAGAYPGEVSWTLVNPSGTTVASGGAPYNQNLCLPTGCYTFNMVDSYGDGWNGANYTFTLGGSSIGTGTLASGASGSAQIGIGTSCAPPASPANDLVCSASAITCGATLSGTTVNATNSGTGENGFCGTNQSQPGVWYVVAGNGQTMTASLCATAWDSKISVLSGTNCSTLTCVGGNDDFGPACASSSASYSWPSVNGQNYYILVHGFSSTSAFSLNLSCVAPPAPPANDNCANAQSVTIQCPVGATAVSGTTANATEEAGIADPSCDPGTIRDVWYTFNSGNNTSVNLSVTLGTANWLGGEIHTTCGNPAPGLTIGGNAGNCDFNFLFPTPTSITGLTPNTIYRLRLFTNVDYDIAGTFTFTITNSQNNPGAVSIPASICVGTATSISNVTAATGAPGSVNYYFYYRGGPSNVTWQMYDGPTTNSSSALPAAVINTPGTWFIARNSDFGCGQANNATTLDLQIIVNEASTAPALSGTSPVCPATSVVLNAAGGTASPGSTINWYTGPNGTGSFLGTGSSYTVTPSATTTYYARREGGCNTTSDGTYTITVNGPTGIAPSNGDMVWRGASSIDWATPSNWYFYNGSSYSVAGVSPNSTTRTIIPSNQTCVTQQPSVAAGTIVNAKDVVIETGATLTMTTGTLNVNGNFTNNGTFVAGTGTVSFNTAGTVSGNATAFNNVDINNGVNFGSNLSTVNGTLSINAGGWVNTNPPIYGLSSLLKYNTGGAYGRWLEWSATSGAGYPNDVQVSNNTTINYPNTGGSFSTNLGVRRDLIIDAGSNLYMDYGTPNASGSLIVGRDVTAAGDLSLGNQIGGDIYLGGNWTRTTGNFYPNSRTVNFTGNAATQTISGTGALNFVHVTIDKTAGVVSMNNDVSISGNLIFQNGNLVLNGKTLNYSGGYNITTNNGGIVGSAALSKLNFTASSQITSNLIASDIYDLTIGDNASVSSAGEYTILNNLTVGNGATFNKEDGPNLTFKGNIVNNGTITDGTSGVLGGSFKFDNTIAQSIGGGQPVSVANLDVNKASGVLNVSVPVTVTGTLAMANGNIVNPSSVITLGTSSADPGTLVHTSGTITGALRRYFDASATPGSGYYFPVGNSSNTRGSTIDFTSSPGTNQYLTVRYQPGTAMGPTPLYDGLPLMTNDAVVIQNYEDEGFWEINPTADNYSDSINSAPYTITLQMKNLTTVNDRSTVRIIKAAGSNNASDNHVTWTSLNFGANPVIGASNTDFTVTGTSTGFSWFGAGSGNNNPLPVELVSFSGVCDNGLINLTWQTASEFNSSHFDVEKSRDGENWQVLTKIQSAGTSNELITYQTADHSAIDGNNYYRLRQVDIDGTEKVYDPINVSCAEVTPGYFSSFPNPSGTSFQLIVNNKELIGTCVLNMVDATGKVIEQREIEVKDGINMFVINQELTPGIYFLNISNGSKSSSVLRHAVK